MTQTEKMTELKKYTRDEVAKQNSREQALIILHDKVYNVTSFLNEHPGGEEILLDHSGKDGSEDFDDVGHSVDAFERMTKYVVGEIVEAERTNTKPKKGWVAGYNTKEPEKEKYVQGPGLPFYLLIGGIFLVIAAALFYR